MGYGNKTTDVSRTVGIYVGRILRGEKAADSTGPAGHQNRIDDQSQNRKNARSRPLDIILTSDRTQCGFGDLKVGSCFTHQMCKYRIRPQTPDDAEDVAKVHVQSWQTSYRGILPDDFLSNISLERRTEMRRKILAAGKGVHLAVVEEETEKIVGFSDAGPARDPFGVGSAELYAIYLLEDKKRLGLGSELFSWTIEELMTLGFSSMHLWVLSENIQARRFYERMGGAVDGEKFNDLGGRSYKEVAYAFQFNQNPRDRLA